MANVLNTLYPPQVDTFMPAFPRKINDTVQDAVVYYSLSPYNETSKIKRVHVSIVDNSTNMNALVLKSGVYICAPEYDDTVGIYKVTIPNSAIYNADNENGESNFKINQFYKVQLRFDLSTEFPDVDNPNANDTKTQNQIGQYLIENRQYFSEWSSVCLIRAIFEPDIFLRTFDEVEEGVTPGFNKGVVPISGNLYFKGENASVSETDRLQSYSIKLVDGSTGEVFIDSGNIYGSGNLTSNDINYKIDLAGLTADNGSILKLRIAYTTKNQYQGVKEYSLQIVEYIEDPNFDPEMTVEPIVDDGIVKVKIKNVMSVFGILYIKRSSNLTHYREWETVYMTRVSGPFDIEVIDNTVSSTDWYRYSVQLENQKGGLSPVYKSEKVVVDFHDAILSRGHRQFAIRYNYLINSFKPTVNRAKIDTLGGKYPKFAENAQMNYKQFAISGLISAQEDHTEAFLGKSDFFDDAELATYSTYRKDNTITEYNDYLWEREFREELVAWLNDGMPKLYRSQTEGNMVVMLTDINLTPNKTLARRIWDFTANVYEIEDGYDMETLDYLGIYDIHADGRGGDGSSWGDNSYDVANHVDVSTALVEKPQQKYFHMVKDNGDFIKNVVLRDIESKYLGVLSDMSASGVSIRNVKVFFHNKPHVYLVDAETGKLSLATRDDVSKENIVLGYRMIVNSAREDAPDVSKEILVSPDGYYQIPNDVTVTSLYFPDFQYVSTDSASDTLNEEITVEYIVSYREESSGGSVLKAKSIDRTAVGQLVGIFKPYDYLKKMIGKRYAFSYPGSYFMRMDSIKGFCVDAQPFTAFQVKYLYDDEYTQLSTDRSGIFNLMDDSPVVDMCFTGRNFSRFHSGNNTVDEWSPADGDFVETWEYVLPSAVEEYGSTKEVKLPQRNCVYKIAGKYRLYYVDCTWYDFEISNDGGDYSKGFAAVPVDGSVTYVCDVLRGDY